MKHTDFPDKVQKNIFKIYLLTIVSGLLYTILIHMTGFSLPCLIHQFTGIYCPGCGMTRAALSLMHGHLWTSLRQNAMIPPLLIVWVIISIGAFFNVPKFCRNQKFLNSFLFVCAGILIVFGIIRNLPCFSFLQPF